MGNYRNNPLIEILHNTDRLIETRSLANLLAMGYFHFGITFRLTMTSAFLARDVFVEEDVVPIVRRDT